MLRATSSTEAARSRLPTRDTIERAEAPPLVEGRLISVNVAILGYGAIAREHALALRRIGQGPHGMRVNLTAVMGRLPAPTRAFAEEFGATLATTDLDELLADPRIEAVIVCSPTDLHAEQTERALRAGKHVLCEIPLATSLAETDHLIELAERSELRLMVCHTQRYAAPLIEARRVIASGEVQPRAMVSRYLLDKRENVSWTGRRRSWTDNLLWHHGCHAVDAALWLLGAEAIDVTARATPPDPRLGIPMDLSILMRTTREQVVTVVMSYRALPPLQDYVVIAEETTLVSANDALRDHRRVLVPASDPGSYDTAAIDRQDAEFFASILTGSEAVASARSVRPAMVALQTAQNAIERQDT
jgi:2-hydroxy-4-carboxymuconate semialdehyde hemiacetal dehydrogenase